MVPFGSSEHKARLDALVSSAKNDSSKLEDLHRRMLHLREQINHLRRGVALTSLSPEVECRLRDLLGISEQACEVMVQRRVLETLAFDGMYGRYEMVEDAHSETFRWTLGLEQDEPRQDDWDSRLSGELEKRRLLPVPSSSGCQQGTAFSISAAS